jgi:hypothetical protein
MTGVNRYLSYDGPETYPVSEAVKGGMLVAGHTDGKARKATAGDTKVLGVAEIDAKPYVNPVSTDSDGFETINVSQLPTEVVAGFGRYPVTYAADCAFGKALKAAANGTVTPWLTGTDAADLIVGYCDQPGGVVVATKATGLANISR